MSRHITQLDDALSAGELATLVGLPIHNNGDIADLCLTSDEWAALTERRRLVGWPLNFPAPTEGVISTAEACSYA
ncbi:hypothetical protein [Xanthomonas euvesicatoria]|uniref:Uncharacterized protein n=1 Tax=Xanthomonas euvesicatoria TaxID=456327 RepID=A0AAW3U261_XANEU|nr:hypothetical protein [Xanthomonas euvesicatoria]MBB4722719.1 hypothetical protein [Xanthomonas euvesicatoria]MBB4869312.1 hypothetical protein [Xanthomonas euvesicatoria]